MMGFKYDNRFGIENSSGQEGRTKKIWERIILLKMGDLGNNWIL
jgi:hypothetical protein